jgi:protein-S-isoprenylcysteine O-methyltransferase Ste14
MQLAFDIVISAASVFVVACYAWSLRSHFSSPKMPPGAMLISAVVAVTSLFFLYLVWSQHQRTSAQVVGLGLEVAGAALFWWAIAASRRARLRFAFDENAPHNIVTEGPYGYLRHPFYTSYLIFWSGWAIAASSAWAIVPVVVFAVIYVTAALAEERKFSTSPLAGDYETYKARTGFFWPRLSG